MIAELVLILRLALAASLYIFFVRIFSALWQGLYHEARQLTARRVPPLELDIQLQGAGAVLRRTFNIAQITVGRDPTCELSLDDSGISSRHASLSYHHNQWWLEDLNSTNGTRLNQSKVTLPTVLTSGDQVECGHSAMIVTIGAHSDPSPTQCIS